MIYYVLEKIFYILFKITLADKIKTKIKANQAQDDLDRKTAKISQLPCS